MSTVTGIELKSEFDTQLKSKSAPKEVDMFQVLANALLSACGTKAVVLHGNKSKVKYSTPSPCYYDDKKSTHSCELCDLAIVVRSEEKNKARLTFMQNKFERGKKFSKSLCSSFEADMRQHDLLNRYLDFTFKGTKHDILSTSHEKSVCSYGVFFKDGSNFDMKYYSADILAPQKSSYSTFKHPVSIKSGITAYSGFDKSKCETDSTRNLVNFGDSLFNLEIGMKIDLNDLSDTSKVSSLVDLLGKEAIDYIENGVGNGGQILQINDKTVFEYIIIIDIDKQMIKQNL